jgi:hypothetical protein
MQPTGVVHIAAFAAETQVVPHVDRYLNLPVLPGWYGQSMDEVAEFTSGSSGPEPLVKHLLPAPRPSFLFCAEDLAWRARQKEMETQSKAPGKVNPRERPVGNDQHQGACQGDQDPDSDLDRYCTQLGCNNGNLIHIHTFHQSAPTQTAASA